MALFWARWRWRLIAVAVLVFAPLQGWLAYLYVQPKGPFLGVAGVKCTLGAMAVDLVLLVVTMRNLDQLHAVTTSNPHSLIGQGLRARDDAAPAPPAKATTQDAWNGRWEDPDRAADRMRGGRY